MSGHKDTPGVSVPGTESSTDEVPASGIDDQAWWTDLRVVLEKHAESDLFLAGRLTRDALQHGVERHGR